ncbi:DUF6049 family protein [Thermocrispum agreste]|uniref:DUF6049 family protein n=1 Tax=Thermocrispum agreste TaxID=37925 RepID=A0ABD6FEN2_9PSEU|nr:DUF6049 family protein [Thermocrispum agreste]
MTERVRTTAAAVAALFVLLGSLCGIPASAQTRQVPPPEPVLKVDVTAMTPRIVTESDDDLRITVRVRNIAKVPVRNLAARLQFGERQRTNLQVRQALRGTAPQDAQSTPFQQVSPELMPGEATEFTLTAALTPGAPNGVAFLEPGVYPLLVNINGIPDGGAEARLAGVNMLLPVRSAPGQVTTATQRSLPLTVLWPIAARPRVAARPFNQSVVLADDMLAAELRPGGRLHTLVEAAAKVRTGGIGDGLCFAIDPDLVATVRDMANGYRVRTREGLVRGEGSEEAKAWLTSLRELVADQCVVATQYAGADLAALAAHSPRLATAAANRSSVLSEVLDADPLPGALWTTDDIDERAAKAVAKAGTDLVVANARGVDVRWAPAEPLTVDGDDSGRLRVLPFDELGALALRPRSASPQLGYPATVAADDRTIAGQNAIATVLFKAMADPSKPMLLAPPRTFAATADEVDWLLGTLNGFIADGLVQPVSLTALAGADSVGRARFDRNATGGRLPKGMMRELDELDGQITDLSEAMKEDPTSQVEPQAIVSPLREALLRTASADFHGVRGARARALESATAQLQTVRHGVRISDPGRTIGLASGSSPIPVSVTNRLPVQITVRVKLTSGAGLRLSQPSAVEIPAGRSRNLKIPAEVLRAGRFTVNVYLSTPGGTQLGEPTTYELTSTEYGVITVIVTATAAGALLLLAGRRIYRRLRSNGAGRG